MAESETYRKGAEMRRRLAGDAWVERTAKTSYADPIMKQFIDFATEHASSVRCGRVPGSISRRGPSSA